ncbi:hypothetical protein GJ744_000501 [Endocarpon pusillum]|uniref:Amidoligase enzyme n=1 Tax=Endocarpon pusillum TaxID=364733 RepID=A0A8H7E1X0_9EURO|nr:hypothetical protein GJ744_000501 [Endocarpon pusillum]
MAPPSCSPNIDHLQMSPAFSIAAKTEKHLRAPTGRPAGLQAVPRSGGTEGSNLTERVLQRESVRTIPTCTFAAGSVASPAPSRQLPKLEFEAGRKKSSKDRAQTQLAGRISQARAPSPANAGSTPSNVGPPSTSYRRPKSTSKEQRTASQPPTTSERHPLDINEDKKRSETATDPQHLESPGDLARVSHCAQPSTSHPASEIRTIKLGIETEFYLASRDTDYHGNDVTSFVAFLTHSYNATVPQQHPRMRPDFRPYSFDGDYHKWCIVLDATMSSLFSPWGLELVSPIFEAFPLSTWRQDVIAAWKFLQSYYDVLGTELCATHIHISIESETSLQDSKRIAQAVIHFETALEALMPPERRGNEYAKSNWLDGRRFGREGLTRHESIAAIEKASHLRELVDLMQPFRFGADRDYAWNFLGLQSFPRTIEFRKPPVSLTPDAVLSWAELALAFVHASVRCESSKLQKVPPTIGGLRWFLHQFHVPGMNEPARLERLWTGKDQRAAVEPIPLPEGKEEEIEDMKARLRVLAEADKRQIQAFADNTQEPYW